MRESIPGVALKLYILQSITRCEVVWFSLCRQQRALQNQGMRQARRQPHPWRRMHPWMMMRTAGRLPTRRYMFHERILLAEQNSLQEVLIQWLYAGLLFPHSQQGPRHPPELDRP